MMRGAGGAEGAEKQAVIRAAINAPMQGTAADIIKVAMIRVCDELSSYDYKMTMQVHDELVFEVLESQVPDFIQAVKHIMETAVVLSVPLVVDAQVGSNWEEAH